MIWAMMGVIIGTMNAELLAALIMLIVKKGANNVRRRKQDIR